MGIIGAFIAIGFLAVVGRVYYLQTVKSEKLGEFSSDQTSGEVTLQASRGNILDRNGVEMAVTTDVPSIYARPKQIERPKRAARRLAPHLEADRGDLVEELTSDRSFVWLERQTKPASAEAIRQLDIRGVGRITEHKRYYPLGPTAGQLLGFVGIDGNGLEGLERMLDDTLAGGDYQLEATRDATGRKLLRKNVPDLSKLQGNTVRLTIDERIQRITQEAIAEQVDKYNAKAGYGVVLDVDTGKVRALANTPKFDPNRFQEFSSEDWRLRTITDSFEPGSVFKPFVLAAALEEQTVSLGTTFDCEEGALQIGRHVIRDTHAHENLTAAEIIQKSSNIGAYKIAQTIGKQRFYEYTKAFGFGSRTGIGIRGEQAGVVWPPERWADVTFANLAFGQGLSATPLQVATAVGAVANDGMLLEPRIVSEIRNPDGELERETEPRLVRRVVSEDVAEKVARTMSLVTTEEGTGAKAALDEYTVAGKTGTAQKVDPETGGYAPDKWIGSFVGFVPAEKPEFAILVMIDEPEETHYGGKVAGPAFREIARKSLAYEGILPLPESKRFDLGTDDEDESEGEETSEQPGGDPAFETRRDSGGEERTAGSASDGVGAPPDESAEDATPGSGLVPDFQGLTLRSAMQRAREAGMSVDVRGWGQVVSQTPEPGRPVPESGEVTLELSPSRRVGPSKKMPAGGSTGGQ
jgi:cell division protein FtsI (penicillin-binding protein 3)